MRQVLAGVFAVLVLVGVGVGVLDLLAGADEDQPLGESPTVAAEAWATAASDGDLEALGGLLTDRADPDLFLDVQVAAWDALGAAPGVVVTDVSAQDNRATATLEHSADLGAPGTWTWTSELELERSRGAWQAAWEPSAVHPGLREGWGLELDRTGPVRAQVLDRDGRALSGSGELVVVGVQPSRLPDRGRLLLAVEDALPEALTPLQELLERDDLEPDWFYPLVTVDAARADAAWRTLVGVPGMLRRSADDAVGTAAFAPELLGAVELEDGVVVGSGGLQGALDDRLNGSEVIEVRLVDADGRVREVLHTAQADASPPLVTTLDRQVQAALQDVLLTVDGAVGVAVVDVAGGGLLATSSLPATGFARALEGRYPPGTVAGVVPVAAALLGGADLQAPLACPPDGSAGGLRVEAGASGPEQRTLGASLAPGCAVGLAGLGADLGVEALAAAGAALGLDRSSALVVEAAPWSGPSGGDAAAAGAAAIGHGTVTTSTVAAAGLAATVARGASVPVHVVGEDAPEEWPALPPGVATGLRQAMADAGASGPVSVDGLELAGIVGRTGLVAGDPAPPTGWWVGWVSAGGPELALAVTVEGDDGSDAAALAQRLLQAFAELDLEQDPQDGAGEGDG